MFQAIYSRNGLQPQLICNVRYDVSVDGDASDELLMLSVIGSAKNSIKEK